MQQARALSLLSVQPELQVHFPARIKHLLTKTYTRGEDVESAGTDTIYGTAQRTPEKIAIPPALASLS